MGQQQSVVVFVNGHAQEANDKFGHPVNGWELQIVPIPVKRHVVALIAWVGFTNCPILANGGNHKHRLYL